jgi:hypothetical protein
VNDKEIPHSGLEQRPHVALKMKRRITLAGQKITTVGIVTQGPESIAYDGTTLTTD